MIVYKNMFFALVTSAGLPLARMNLSPDQMKNITMNGSAIFMSVLRKNLTASWIVLTLRGLLSLTPSLKPVALFAHPVLESHPCVVIGALVSFLVIGALEAFCATRLVGRAKRESTRKNGRYFLNMFIGISIAD
jgi:hypothetical protein